MNWDWERAAQRAGVARDGRFNAGGVAIDHPAALVWKRADGGTRTLSGTKLASLARRTASVLKVIGVRRGDRVAGLLGRRPESFAVPLAAWQLGAVYVPLFSGFGPEALHARLDDSGTTVVVTDPHNRPSLDPVRGRLGELAVLLVGGEPAEGDFSYERLLADAAEDTGLAETHRCDPATIMYTSGTSGQPKGCVIPHHGILSLWPYVERCLAVSTDDVLFSTADTGWSFGLYTTGLSPLSLGRRRVLYEGGFDAAAWWATIRALGVTHLASAPTGFRQLAAAGGESIGDGTGVLAAATSAGEPLPPEVMHWWREHVGVVIHDSYGLTELGMVIANLHEPGAPPPEPGSMGYPVPGFEVRLVDLDGHPVADGEQGRVAVRDNGFLLTSTYWGREQEWTQRLEDGWWVTEDLAERDVEGRYWYVGRSDDVIVTAGYNVGPFEVERVLLEHPLVIDAACVAEPDERKGQVVAAHVVLVGDEPEALADELKRWVGERIGWHAAPRRVHVRTELPRTESGKVRRRDLRASEGRG